MMIGLVSGGVFFVSLMTIVAKYALLVRYTLNLPPMARRANKRA